MAGQLDDSIIGVYGASDIRTGINPSTRELKIVDCDKQNIKVGGNNHATWFRMLYSNQDESQEVQVTVGNSVANDSGYNTVAKGTCILFSQETTNPLVFIPDKGVKILTPTGSKAYGKNSTVTLISMDINTWILGGDLVLESDDGGGS